MLVQSSLLTLEMCNIFFSPGLRLRKTDLEFSAWNESQKVNPSPTFLHSVRYYKYLNLTNWFVGCALQSQIDGLANVSSAALFKNLV